MTLSSIIDLLSNLAVTNSKCAALILNKTSIAEFLWDVILHHDSVEGNIFGRLILLASEFTKTR